MQENYRCWAMYDRSYIHIISVATKATLICRFILTIKWTYRTLTNRNSIFLNQFTSVVVRTTVFVNVKWQNRSVKLARKIGVHSSINSKVTENFMIVLGMPL